MGRVIARAWPPPVLAGRYELGRSLGQGGMGGVWEAHDRHLDRDVAIKLIRFDSHLDDHARARFTREARAAARLTDPHVVTVFDSSVDDDVAYLVMELLPGPDLMTLLRTQGPLPVDEVLSYAEQAASGLASAHAHGILHRDVKPANLMLTSHGTVKVVDFGVASVQSSSDLTSTGHMVGTLAYMAPEVSLGIKASPQSDLYSLGCVMVTLLLGHPPFAGTTGNVVLKHLQEPPPPIRAERPDVPPEAEALIAQLLAKEAADRPSSAAEVAQRLRTLRQDPPSNADATVASTGAVADAPSVGSGASSVPVGPGPTAGPVGSDPVSYWARDDDGWAEDAADASPARLPVVAPPAAPAAAPRTPPAAAPPMASPAPHVTEPARVDADSAAATVIREHSATEPAAPRAQPPTSRRRRALPVLVGAGVVVIALAVAAVAVRFAPTSTSETTPSAGAVASSPVTTPTASSASTPGTVTGLTKAATIDNGSTADGVVIDPDSGRVFVTACDEAVTVNAFTMDGAADGAATVSTSAPGRCFLAYDSNRRRIYLTYLDYTIVVLDADSLKKVGSIRTKNKIWAMAIDSDRQVLYGAAEYTDRVSIIDISTDEGNELASVPVQDGAWALALDRTAQRLYVAGPTGVSVIDTETRGELNRVAMSVPGTSTAGTSAIAVDEARHVAYVVDESSAGKQKLVSIGDNGGADPVPGLAAKPVGAVAMAPGGYLYVGVTKGIEVYDLSARRSVSTRKMSFTSEDLIVDASDGEVVAWEYLSSTLTVLKPV